VPQRRSGERERAPSTKRSGRGRMAAGGGHRPGGRPLGSRSGQRGEPLRDRLHKVDRSGQFARVDLCAVVGAEPERQLRRIGPLEVDARVPRQRGVVVRSRVGLDDENIQNMGTAGEYMDQTTKKVPAYDSAGILLQLWPSLRRRRFRRPDLPAGPVAPERPAQRAGGRCRCRSRTPSPGNAGDPLAPGGHSGRSPRPRSRPRCSPQ
jgi:hypothetical protein